MLAPSPSRTDAEIVAAMLDVLKPKAGERAALTRKLRRCVEVMRSGGAHWASDKKKRRQKATRQVRRYRTRLRAVTRYRPDWWGHLNELDENEAFLAALDGEIERVNAFIGPGKRPTDVVAQVAVMESWKLLPPAQRTRTAGKAWHTLSMLLYEAGTGKANCDHVLNYMAMKIADPPFDA
jgi:hypothetical protein